MGPLNELEACQDAADSFRILASRVRLRLQMVRFCLLLRFFERCVIRATSTAIPSYSVKDWRAALRRIGARRTGLAPGPGRPARRRGLGRCLPLLHAGRHEETTRTSSCVHVAAAGDWAIVTIEGVNADVHASAVRFLPQR